MLKKNQQKFLKAGDVVAIVLVLIIAGGLLLYQFFAFRLISLEDLEIVLNNQEGEVMRLAMVDIPEEGKILEIAGPIGIHQVLLSPEGVRVIAPAEDPLKICEKTGMIQRPGPVIVCIPNRVAIWIEGSTEDQLDGISE